MAINISDVLSQAVTIFASGVVSYLISVRAARSEIKKLELTWTREDSKQVEMYFTAMVTAVDYFSMHPSGPTRKDALEAVSHYRSICPVDGAVLVDALAKLLRESSDVDLVARQLREIMAQHRETVVPKERKA